MAEHHWRVENHHARLLHPRLHAQIDLDDLAQGVHAIAFEGRPCPNMSCAMIEFPVAGPPPLASIYVRGADLIAGYLESPLLPFRLDVYWRIVDEPAEGMHWTGWETIVSVQTSQLGIDPRLTIRSRAAEAERTGGGSSDNECRAAERAGAVTSPGEGELFVVESRGQTYLEMLHPAASHATNVRSLGGHGIEVAHSLFGERLEKGVILRARLRSLFTSSTVSGDALSRMRARFALSEPVLTA